MAQTIDDEACPHCALEAALLAFTASEGGRTFLGHCRQAQDSLPPEQRQSDDELMRDSWIRAMGCWLARELTCNPRGEHLMNEFMRVYAQTGRKVIVDAMAQAAAMGPAEGTA